MVADPNLQAAIEPFADIDPGVSVATLVRASAELDNLAAQAHRVIATHRAHLAKRQDPLQTTARRQRPIGRSGFRGRDRKPGIVARQEGGEDIIRLVDRCRSSQA